MLDYLPPQWEQRNAVNPLHGCYTDPGFFASLRMTQEKEPESKRASSPFCDFFSPGAGVTPAEGNVKPTVGFTFD